MKDNEVDIMDLIETAEVENYIGHVLTGTGVSHGYFQNGIIYGAFGSTPLPSPVNYDLPTIEGGATRQNSNGQTWYKRK